jgi:hypothetical protein
MLGVKLIACIGFIVLLIVISMLLGQESMVRTYSPVYLTVVLPTLFVPLFWCRDIAAAAVLATSYGSILHPSSYLFVLYFQLLIHGRKTFAGDVREDITTATAGNPYVPRK